MTTNSPLGCLAAVCSPVRATVQLPETDAFVYLDSSSCFGNSWSAWQSSKHGRAFTWGFRDTNDLQIYGKLGSWSLRCRSKAIRSWNVGGSLADEFPKGQITQPNCNCPDARGFRHFGH
jgi:hypothetical protein